MPLIVQKYGGTSVSDASRIQNVAQHIANTQKNGTKEHLGASQKTGNKNESAIRTDIVVVISAMGNETDELLKLADEVSSVKSSRELDMLITSGERKSAALLCLALGELGVDAVSLTGSQAGLITDEMHQNAKIRLIQPKRINDLLQQGKVAVIAGSQGVSGEKEITFLGRGGSDTTAVALAHQLNADSCELYTDVSGIFTADPRIVPNARQMPEISFEELLDMTATGCPKPSMRAVEVARTYNVKLHIRSAFTLEEGTFVGEESDLKLEQAIISAVTHDLSEAKITILGVPDKPGIAASLFRSLAEADVNVDMIMQNISADGITDISFTCPKSNLKKAMEITKDMAGQINAKDVVANDAIARVSLVGAGMKTNPGVAATVFETMSNASINIEMISTSAIRISCVIKESDAEKAVRELHAAFNLGPEQQT